MLSSLLRMASQLILKMDASPSYLYGLREVVQGLLVQGHDQNTLIAALERFRGSLHDTDRDDVFILVLEIMDFLTGWCSPHMKL